MRTLSLALALIVAGSAGLAGPASAEGPVATSGGPNVNFRGCIYYEHANFGGEQRAIEGGVRRRYVGDHWNDRISSIACNPSCYVVVYEHRDYGGAHWTFHPNIQYVGDDWNDAISSLEARCR